MARLDVPTLIVSDAAAFRAWLDANRDRSEGVWLVLAKKGMTDPTSLTYAQALEEALCQGWIDGQKRSRDATTFAQRFTPRRRTSQWSKRNLRIAEELIAEGRMLPAGLAEIDQAKADGRWAAAYSGQAEASVPADLSAALSANPAAEKMFADLNGANRYAVLYRIETAKRAETRSRRIDQFVEMLARGETIHPNNAPDRNSPLVISRTAVLRPPLNDETPPEGGATSHLRLRVRTYVFLTASL
jgi:uncharacterized protein YdeI (YjbR/CyaY-like superfamily)